MATMDKVPVLNVGDRTLYGLQPKQWEAFQLTPLAREPDERGPKHIGYGGASGGGKSHLARAVAAVAAFKWPGSTTLILRQTRDEVKQNHVNKFFQEVPRRIDGQKLYSWNGQEMVITWRPIRGHISRTFFGYLREESDVERYQGNEYDIIIFEEATHYPFESVRWLVGNRLRATQQWTRPFALYPSNPGSRGHAWYKRLFIDRRYDPGLKEQPEDYAFVQAKVEDNHELMERDPLYVESLDTLPEPYRSWLRDGDWDAGLGLALAELIDRSEHLKPAFRVPDHWRCFGAFDWGFAHPFSFGIYAVDEHESVWKVDTVTGRHLQPHEIAERIHHGLDAVNLTPSRLDYIDAGHDTWAKRKAWDENTPTLAEQFADHGLMMRQANIDRIQGLQNMRKYMTKANGGPRFRLMDTKGNRDCLSQLEEIPTDPDNPEDALKTDADLFGHAGDDMYDETRYGLASRPFKATLPEEPPPSAWDPEVLKHEAMEGRRVKEKPEYDPTEVPLTAVEYIP